MRPRTVFTIVVLGLGLTACGSAADRADIASAGDPASTGPATTVPPTSTLPPTPTSAGPTPTSATTPTTARPVTTSTRAPATTAAPPSTPSTAMPRCENVPLTVDVSTDRATYRPGEIVKGTFALRNTSGAACVFRNYSFAHHVEDGSGRTVGSAGAGHTDGFADSTLAAGATDMVLDLSWDKMVCDTTCSPAPPGAYTVKASFTVAMTPVGGSASFRLAAA